MRTTIPRTAGYRAGRFLWLAGALALGSALPARADFRLTDKDPAEELGGEPAVQEPVLPETPDPLPYRNDLWNRARNAIEEAEKPPAPAAPVKPAAATEPAPGISFDLPYESGLSISGRKLIAFRMEQTRRRSAKRASELGVPAAQNDVEMKQELQVRIKGKVGRKITVNVDFDDTKDDKRDISVVYQGDPGEFVQEAAFGDITLSLPSTEFVSYSKQLFGVRAKLQYKNASLMAIGSRTKGTTETRRFNGATKFERRLIRDVDFIKKQYYSIAFTTRTIVPQSEEVWRDDRVPSNDNPPLTRTLIVEDAVVPLANFTGQFDRLKPGDDYTVDYRRGLIQFKRRVDDNAVLAVDFTFTDGTKLSDLNTPGRLKLIKTAGDQPITSGPIDPAETGYRRELKTFYSLGNIKIVRDNGRGNFILRTVDANQNDKVVLISTAADASVDAGTLTYPRSLEVDFDLGVFNVALSSVVFDAQLYGPSPTSNFSFLSEYRYRLKDYQVRPNIVFGSERVTVNGRPMKNEIDYFMDYGTGLLQFFNEDELDESSQIEVTYEYAPFGGQLGQTLVGTRAELDIVPNRFKVGSTFLYTFAPKTDLIPDVRSTPNSLMVLEMDGRVTDVEVPFVPLKFTLAGEAAQSRENPNLFGKALVDSMEGIRQEDGAVLDLDFWQLASPPSLLNGGVYGEATRPTAVAVGDELFKLRDIVNNSVDIPENESLRVLRVDYSLLRKPGGGPADAEEASLIQPISKAGRDFSKKAYIDLWVEGAGAAGANVDLDVDAGSLNEDADLDNNRDREDLNDDGTLNSGEDIGFPYDFQSTTFRQGAGNGRLDTEDLDGDGVLQATDRKPFAGPLFRLSNGIAAVDRNGVSSTVNDLGFTGWRFIRIPLNTSLGDFHSIRQVRLTLRGLESAPGVARAGTVRFGKIAFVGNTWESATVTAGAAMDVAAVNNLDNPDYRSLLGDPSYNEIYGDQASNRTREQALQLSFNLPAGSTATTRSVYGLARDFSHHRTLNFFYQVPLGQPTDETLLLQMGSETDYFQWALPLSAAHVNRWTLESLRLVDVNNDGTPDLPQSDTPGARVTIVGVPSLARIGQLKIGVTNGTGGAIAGKVWVNEIHVSGSRKKIGNARRFAADGNWEGWGNFGGVFRSVDRNFQTLTSPIVNQDREESSAYANLTRWRYVPLSGTVSRSKTLTPAALRTGDSTLVSVLSEGREETVNSKANGQFLFPAWPAIAYSAERNITESTDREERRDRNTYAGSVDYVIPVRPDLIPGKKFVFRPLPETAFVKYTRTNYFLSYFPERKERQVASSTDTTVQRSAIFSNARTSEFTDDWSGRLGFTPWDGLTLTPTYGQKRVTEHRRFDEGDLFFAPLFTASKDYNKSFTQTHGLSGSWRMFRWLEPRLTYNFTGTETNGLPTASSPTAASAKTLDRSGTGDLFVSLAPRDLLPNTKVFRTLNIDNSFRIESADTYENVSNAFRDWRKRQVLRLSKIHRKDGRAMYGLLTPLEFNDPATRRKQLTARNTSRFSANWTPLDWIPAPLRLQPLKTLNLTGTYTNTDEHTENTETLRDVNTVSWPDVLVTLRDTEKFMGLEKWMSGSQINLRANRKRSETFNEELSDSKTNGGDYRLTLFARYDCFLSYSRTDSFVRDLRTGLLKTDTTGLNHSYQVGAKYGSWRVTPSATFRLDHSVDGTGRALQDLDTQTYSVLGRFDRSYPSGFRFPFTKKVFGNVNRLTVDVKTSFERRASSLNFERDNTDTYSGEATGEWEISRNFRLSFGGKTSVVNNRAKPEDGLMTLELNSQLVIQF